MSKTARAAWDPDFARELEGSVVLVGMTYYEPTGPQRDQFHGVVERADPAEGVAIRLSGSRAGELFMLPADLRAFFPAAPGSYRLETTGEVVVDPDYLTTWDMTPNPS